MLLGEGNSRPPAGIASFPGCEEPILAHLHGSLTEAQLPHAGAGASALSLTRTARLAAVLGLHLTNCELQAAYKNVYGDFPPKGQCLMQDNIDFSRERVVFLETFFF